MQCPQCQHENPEGARFCNSCGAKLEAICPACNHVNPPGSRFCNACGHNLTIATPQPVQSETEQQSHPEPPPPEPPPPDAERRQLTVMFCDLADSTRLSSQLDPEDLRDVIRAYQFTSAEVIERYDGYIAQHLGDGLMVYFGWPQAHEDDAQRAVHAGLGIIEAMQGLNARLEQEKGIRLTVRIGIHTGLVVVGGIGQGARQEHLALGGTPNIASRIEGIAEPDTVTISRATYQLVQGYFVCDDLGQHALKGVDGPQQAYRVVRASGAQSRLEVGVARGLTPLVGRERDLAVLQDRFAEVQAGRGQAVFVYGEAGIGKSRMLLESRRQIETAGARWLVGRCVSYGRSMAYLPMLDVVRELADIQEADDVATILHKLDTGIRRISVDLAWTIPFVRMLLSLDAGDTQVTAMVPAQRRGRTAEALQALLLGASQRQPIVLFIEDLHWIDVHSEEIIQLVLERIATVPVLVLLTHRPGYTPPFGDQTYYTRLTLHQLSDPQMRTMVEGVLHSAGVPEEVLALIVQRAEGNPLFIEELCKSLVEDNILQRANGGYRLTRSLIEVAIPGTIQDVIMARIDRLPEVSKTALQIASVIGREFTARLIERVSGMQRNAPQALRELRAVELIYEKTIFPELAYMFKHALTHDVAYESLLRQRRRDLHRHVGEVIEELYTERIPEFYETLAWHFGRGEDWAKAVDYLLKATDQARSRFAYAEAIRYGEEAVGIMERQGGEPETMVRACETLGDLHSLLGQVDPANRAYGLASELADTPVSQQRLANKCHRLGMAVCAGASIAYYEHGSGEPSVFLMYPAVYGISHWQPIVELLCQEFRVIVIEPRGAGKSSPLSRPYLLRDHVEDVRAVIEATGGRPVVFVGTSRGAALVVNFAATYPSLVEKLVLVGAQPTSPRDADYPVPLHPEYRRQFQPIRTKLQAGDYEEAMRIFSSYVCSEPGTRNLIEVRMKAWRAIPREVLQDFYMLPDPGRDIRPLLPTLQMPTLVLHGEADRVVPVEAGRYVADHIPGARFYLFKGRGHSPMATATTEFVQVLRHFIRTGQPI